MVTATVPDAHVVEPRTTLWASQWLAAASVSFWWLLMLSASWPGWMPPDSQDQWHQATSGPITDWHAVMPTLAWHFLSPLTLGPRIPLLIQTLAFGLGLLLSMVWAQRRSVLAAWLCFAFVVISPFTWNLAWVLTDGWILGSLALGTGLLLISTDVRSRAAACSILLTAGATIGVSALARPYTLPILLLWGVACLIFVSQKIRRPLLILVLAIVASFGIGVLTTRLAEPTPTYSAGSTMLLDLARIECGERANLPVTPPEGAIPRELIVQGEAGDICALFSSSTWNPLVWNESPTKVRLPVSPDEYLELRKAWVTRVLEDPSMVAAGKIEAFALLISSPVGEWMPPLTGQNVEPGGMSYVDVVEEPLGLWTNTGGLPLSLAALPANMTRNIAPGLTSALLLVIIVPGYTLVRFCRRVPAKGPRVRGALLAIVPVLYVAYFSLLAPATDTRYTAPAQVMGLLAGMILWAVSAPERTQAETAVMLSGARDDQARGMPTPSAPAE